MQKYWLRHDDGNRKLVLFVLGWGCDHRCVGHIDFGADYDVLTTYDYRTLEPLDAELFSHYDSIVLLAWSFGVWVAEQIMGSTIPTVAIAYNGTPRPVDRQFGIDPKRLAITIRGFSRNGTDEFHKRTYGEAFNHMRDKLTTRTTEETIDELTALYEASKEDYMPHIEWSKAVVGEKDVIFPVENMIAYWGFRAEVLPLPHYPFYDPQLIIKEVENR